MRVKLLITYTHFFCVFGGPDPAAIQSSKVPWDLKFLTNMKIWHLFRNVLKLNFLYGGCKNGIRGRFGEMTPPANGPIYLHTRSCTYTNMNLQSIHGRRLAVSPASARSTEGWWWRHWQHNIARDFWIQFNLWAGIRAGLTLHLVSASPRRFIWFTLHLVSLWTSLVQQGTSLGSCPTTPFPKTPIIKKTLYQILSDERQR